VDPLVQGTTKYWDYTLNELGLFDLGAQLEFIHKIKCAESRRCCGETQKWKVEYSPYGRSIDFRCIATVVSEEERLGLRSVGMKPSRSFDDSMDAKVWRYTATRSGEQFPSAESGVRNGEDSVLNGSRECREHEPHHRRVSGKHRCEGVTSDTSLPAEVSSSRTQGFQGPNCPHAATQFDSLDESLGVRGSAKELPYRLRAVGHSLGGAALLLYLTMASRRGQTHNLSRLILLSPAGFHERFPALAYPFIWFLPYLHWVWTKVLGLNGMGVLIPNKHVRLAVFKALQDALRIPALAETVKRAIRWLLNGDKSPWECAMQVPHFGVQAMPGLSMHTALHLIQMVKSRRFQTYDYGTPEENMRRYGSTEPIDLAAEYQRIDIPVDCVAGAKDGIIPPSNVQMHVSTMRKAGVEVTYKEFDYSHLEFSLTVKEDLMTFVLDRLKKNSWGSQ